MQCFLNIKVSQTATASEPSANTLLIKLNTTAQDNRGNNGSGQDTTNTKKQNSLFLDNMKHARKNILNMDFIQNTRNKQRFRY
mgnify:CR=1 FL=1